MESLVVHERQNLKDLGFVGNERIGYSFTNNFSCLLLIVNFGKVIVLNNSGFWLVTITDDMRVLNQLEVLDVVCFVNFEFRSGNLKLAAAFINRQFLKLDDDFEVSKCCGKNFIVGDFRFRDRLFFLFVNCSKHNDSSVQYMKFEFNCAAALIILFSHWK